jgi:hypothetical protein
MAVFDAGRRAGFTAQRMVSDRSEGPPDAVLAANRLRIEIFVERHNSQRDSAARLMLEQRCNVPAAAQNAKDQHIFV